ncbi:MAG: carboxypeptidase regulatory-like domain-containing protein, partial [Sarcina sp.]
LLHSVVNGTNTLIAITYTDTAGIFVFSELEPGNYKITINALGYLQSEATATVQSGIITTLSKVLYINPQAPNGIISGIITDSTNKPVSGADVILYHINNTNNLTPVAFTTTNTMGIYTFINVPEGDYLVKSNQSQIVTVNPSTTPISNIPTTTTSTTTPITDTTISTVPTSLTGTTTPISSIGLGANEFTFKGMDYNIINSIQFDTTSKKIIAKSTGTQSHPNLPTTLYFGISIYDASNNLKASVFLLGKDNGNNFASLLNGLSFDYGYYLKIFHYEPFLLSVSGTVCGAPSDLSKGFNGIDLNKVKFYIQPSGLQYTITDDSNASITTSEVVTTVNSNSGSLFNTVSVLNGTFVGAIGDSAGYVTVPISVPSEGIYNLSIQYLCGDTDRLLQVDVNGSNTGMPYIAPKTNDWTATNAKTINAIVNLNAGTNNIKLFNAPNTPGPWVGNLTIQKALADYNLNAVDGILTNTSTILDNTF